MSVYGFLTNSLVKILVMIEGGDGSGGLRDSDVKYVRILCSLFVILRRVW